MNTGSGYTRRNESVRCTGKRLMVESQDISWVLRNGGIVPSFRLCWRDAIGIAGDEIPESHWNIIFGQSKNDYHHEKSRTVLSMGVGCGDDLIVHATIRRAHPSGLNTNDTLQGH